MFENRLLSIEHTSLTPAEKKSCVWISDSIILQCTLLNILELLNEIEMKDMTLYNTFQPSRFTGIRGDGDNRVLFMVAGAFDL